MMKAESVLSSSNSLKKMVQFDGMGQTTKSARNFWKSESSKRLDDFKKAKLRHNLEKTTGKSNCFKRNSQNSV